MLAAVMPSFATVVFPGKEPGPAEDQASKQKNSYLLKNKLLKAKFAVKNGKLVFGGVNTKGGLVA